MAIERRLIEMIGPAGGRLHTARSRNDQVALDLRLFVRAEIGAILKSITAFQKALVTVARTHVKVVMPGYTHLQRAQPVLFAHHLLAYHDMLERDSERFADCRKRVPTSCRSAPARSPVRPFRSTRARRARAALRTHRDQQPRRRRRPRFHRRVARRRRADDGAPLAPRRGDRALVLGRVRLHHAARRVRDRQLDHAAEEESDVAELARGKTGRVYGNLVAMLTVLKGLPLAYNRDLQEDKPPLFDAVDTVQGCLAVLTALLPRLTIHAERMRDATTTGFLLATDVADYLVTKGVPFREAHRIVGRAVRRCLATGRASRTCASRRSGARSPTTSPPTSAIGSGSMRRSRGEPPAAAPRRRTSSTASAAYDSRSRGRGRVRARRQRRRGMREEDQHPTAGAGRAEDRLRGLTHLDAGRRDVTLVATNRDRRRQGDGRPGRVRHRARGVGRRVPRDRARAGDGSRTLPEGEAVSSTSTARSYPAPSFTIASSPSRPTSTTAPPRAPPRSPGRRRCLRPHRPARRSRPRRRAARDRDDDCRLRLSG